MKAIMAAGGTGGHIYPALAIAQGIKNRWPESKILFIGTSQGLEHTIVPQAGYDFAAISAAGLDRSSMLKALGSALKVPIGFWQARKIIADFKPDIVVGTGGYVSYPTVLAASLMHIKTAIHEQNAYPGLANRMLGSRVDCIMLTFEEAQKHFPEGRTRITGLPVRMEFMEVNRRQGCEYFEFTEDKFTLVIFGGSRGASSINKAVMGIISKYRDLPVNVIWITGELNYDKIINDLNNCGGIPPNFRIYPYLHHMEYALAVADLAVCRAGAATISEMAVRGVPAIFVPYPYASESHQEKNARYLEAKGAAVTIIDEFLDDQSLFRKIEELRNNKFRLLRMRQVMKEQGRPNALEDIIGLIGDLVYDHPA